MANYKVPQDVEADDKLIGPFSFRQFVYLLIVAGMIALAWAFSKVFLPLAVLPVPVILLFGALALPLRKDQPMEIYLAALISFYLKPRVRTWDPDGVGSLIEITAPHVEEVIRSKNITQEDAQQRFGYLADLVDSEGWAVRGQGMAPNTAMTTDSYLAAQQAEDVLAADTSVAQSFNQMIAQEDAKRREEMIARMHAPAPIATPTAAPLSTLPPIGGNSLDTPIMAPSTPVAAPDPTVMPSFNPYPTIQQMVIQPPSDDKAHQLPMAAPIVAAPVMPVPAPTPPPAPVVSADMVNLENNPDLSIETIAREANRIQHKEEESQDNQSEFVVSLR